MTKRTEWKTMKPRPTTLRTATGELPMLKRIHIHWTAGADGIIQLEDDHYNFIVDRTGKVHEGEHPPEAQTPENVKKGSAHYAAHTLNANSYAIGVSMDAMADAKESPFNAGKYPITTVQVESTCEYVARLCKKYGIPVTRQTVLTHAEVQTSLGIKQNGKWDITWIPGMSKPGNAIDVGDVLRAKVQAYLSGLNGVLVATPTKPALSGVAVKPPTNVTNTTVVKEKPKTGWALLTSLLFPGKNKKV